MKLLLTGALLGGLAALSFSAVLTLDARDHSHHTAQQASETHFSDAVARHAGNSDTRDTQTQKASQQPAGVAKTPVGAELARNDADAGNAGAGAPPLPKGFAPFGENIGGTFDLIDHFGDAKQLEDYRGKHVMVFFGYANCLAICSAALPLMADTIDLLGDVGKDKLVPLMITVDPENDTPDFMREKLAEYHPALIGMTGSEGALADVRKKFQVRTEYVGEDIDGNPIYNHGSFIYLLGPDGKFQTLVPPILGPPQMAKIISKYLTEADS